MSVNEQKQVGGDHYRVPGRDLQHWDIARLFSLDYFQGQITKYVLRWKDKHTTPEKRLEDLKKARQFLDKYIEDAEFWDTHVNKVDPSSNVYRDMVPLHRHLGSIVNENWAVEGYNGDGTQHYRCRHCGTQILRAKTVEEASQTHGHCASGRGYTSQG